MHRNIWMAPLIVGALGLAGCESMPEGGGALGEFGRTILGDVVDTASATASVEVIQNTTNSMCSAGNTMCRNLTTVAMTGFTDAFVKQLTERDVREINDARARSIATRQPQEWENPETGTSGRVESKPAPPRASTPTPVKVKKDRLESLPPMDAVGEPYVVTSSSTVNVRGGPGSSYRVVDTLAPREKVQAIGKIRTDNWYLVGRGSVGIGYVYGPLLERWTAPADQSLDEALEPVADADAADTQAADVAQVDLEMASECFTTTQTVTLSNGGTEQATVTSCRTPDGWAQV